MAKKTWITAAAGFTVAALALGGCSSPSAEPANETGAGKLSVLSLGSADSVFATSVAEFQKANPDIEVDVTYADAAALQTTLRTQLTAGTAPDVFTVWPGMSTTVSIDLLAPESHLADLSDLPFASELPESLKPLSTYDGKLYMLPLSVGSIGFVYNEKAMKDAGVSVPTTWSEVLKYCDAANAAGKVPLAFGAQDGWTTQLYNYALTPTLLYSQQPTFNADIDAGKASFEDSAWLKSMEMTKELQDRKCFQDDILGTPYTSVTSMLASGEALATVGIAGFLGPVPEGTDYILVGLPATENPADTWLAAGSSSGYAINAKSKNPVAAQRFLEYLATPESMAERATAGGSYPAIDSAYVVQPATQALSDALAAGHTYPWMDQLWPNPRVAEEHINGMQQFLGGLATPQQVLQNMDAAWGAK